MIDRGAFAQAGRSEHEHVVPVPPNADAELDRIQCPGLTQNLLQILQVIGGFKRQVVCRTAPSQLGGAEFHGVVPANRPGGPALTTHGTPCGMACERTGLRAAGPDDTIVGVP